MTPVWIFPAYPLLIAGPHAGNLAQKVSPEAALRIILSGWVLQGIGFMVSLMIYSAFLYRLMTQKLPQESLRPGMFISVGPSGFTIAAVILMGQNLPFVIPADFMGPGTGVLAGKVSMIVANWIGLWLWGLALFWFVVSVGAHWNCVVPGKRRQHIDFAMTWYSFVFPNTALTTATFAVARALDGNRNINIVGCVMAVALVATWVVVFGMMVRAVWLRQILWPQKQEDRDEGGWDEGKRSLMRLERGKGVDSGRFWRGRSVERSLKGGRDGGGGGGGDGGGRGGGAEKERERERNRNMDVGMDMGMKPNGQWQATGIKGSRGQ